MSVKRKKKREKKKRNAEQYCKRTKSYYFNAFNLVISVAYDYLASVASMR